MRRPIGVTILAIVLATQTYAGVGNAYFIFTGAAWGSRASAFLALVYGLVALVAAVGLWRMYKWAYWAVILCSGIIVSLGLSFLPFFPIRNGIALLIFVTITLCYLARYVRKALAITL
jgi:uncharacterized membrane protein (DUF2068 family)